jgi:predicted transcriptional regulator
MSREEQQFIGAYVPADIAARLALAAAVLNESRSAMTRQALAEFIAKMNLAGAGSLVARMAARLSGQWKDQQASAKGAVSYKDFVAAERAKLLEAGVSEELVSDVVKRIKHKA